MPIFEYVCRKCGHGFEKIVAASERPACPECSSRKLEKQLSVFAASTKGEGAARVPSEVGFSSCGTCGDPRGPGSCSMN